MAIGSAVEKLDPVRPPSMQQVTQPLRVTARPYVRTELPKYRPGKIVEVPAGKKNPVGGGHDATDWKWVCGMSMPVG